MAELQAERIAILKTHLPYELDQLDAAYVFAGRPAEAQEGLLLRLMAIDCFYLHARSLIEFYGRRPTKTDGRTAAAWEFTNDPIDYPSDETKFSALINDQVAHLNYARGANSEQPLSGASMIQIHTVLDQSLQKFQHHLTKEALQHWKHREPRGIWIQAGNQESACNEIYMSTSEYLPGWFQEHGNAVYIIDTKEI